MELTIYRRIFFSADCFQKGVKQKSIGVQVHSTGCNNPWLHRYVQPDDGRIGVNKYGNSHNRAGITTCASAYIGKQSDGTVAIYQALPWDYRCWLSGSGEKGNANRLGYIGFEVLEDGHTNPEYFRDAMMVKAAALTAYLCQIMGVGVEAVKDHRELHDMGLASNHGDIQSWSKTFGVSTEDFRTKVKQYLEEGVTVTYIDCDDAPVLFLARCECSGKYLNLRAEPSTKSASLAQIERYLMVQVLDDSDAVWWRCRFNGMTGYCMSQYLAKMTAPSTPETTADDVVTIRREDAYAAIAALEQVCMFIREAVAK